MRKTSVGNKNIGDSVVNKDVDLDREDVVTDELNILFEDGKDFSIERKGDKMTVTMDINLWNEILLCYLEHGNFDS